MSPHTHDMRVILTTGANSGLGSATAKVIASASPKYHAIIAARYIDKGTAAVEELQRLVPSGQFSFLHLDVTGTQSCEKAAAKIEQDFGRLDVLINNAGIMKNAQNQGITKETLPDVFTANMVEPVLLTRVFNPMLLKSTDSHGSYSMFVSSGLGSIKLASQPDHPIAQFVEDTYRMFKAGLDMFVVQQHRQLQPKGVKVFAVCPGVVKSNLRGSDEVPVNLGGRAISADTSGEFMLRVTNEERDSDIGCFVHRDGVYPW